jgi:hypothetical protein
LVALDHAGGSDYVGDFRPIGIDLQLRNLMRIARKRRKIRRLASVCQKVEVIDPAASFNPPYDEIGSDESCTTYHDD